MILFDHNGKSVRLPQERLDHFKEKVVNAGMLDKLEETLRDPEIVVQSKWDEEATLSYRFYTGTPVGNKWLCVVVKHEGLDAFVLTAYPTDQIKKGTTIWKRT